MSNLNTLTAQEVYDIVKSHLLAQGMQSLDISGDCLYRGPNGTSCAVGCLIPDDDYLPRMEGHTVDSLILPISPLRITEGLVKFISNNKKLLLDLQDIHDKYPVEYWPGYLAQVAINHNLIP